MKTLEQLYKQAQAALSEGRTDRARASLMRAATELEAIAAAMGQPRQRSRTARRRLAPEEISLPALRSAQARLEALVAEVAARIDRVEDARERVRESRRFHKAFGHNAAAGTVFDERG
ncbi:hypothetical protein ACFL6M_04490 [Candidatus Eisenbacteria bacterium]|uniref:Flagellar protein FliT n=1 Tax=Eiseniibacteriota bacterium TaxID=2212470 RepID=A0ABV6YKZ1_UNCEI